MYLKPSLSFFFIIMTTGFSFGQTTFESSIGGTSTDDGFEIIERSNGSFKIIGTTASYGGGETAIYSINVSPDGITGYGTVYSRNSINCWLAGKDILELSNGKFLIAASLDCLNPQGFLLVKCDEFGNIEWHKLMETGYVLNASIIETMDGGYAMTGTSHSSNYSFNVTKIDSSGNFIWSKTFHEGYYCKQRKNAIVERPNGNLIVVSSTYYEPTDEHAILILEFDSDGNMIFHRTLKYDDTYGSGIIKLTTGGFLVMGYTTSSWYGYDLIIRLDDELNIVWSKYLSNYDYSEWGQEAFIETADGNYVFLRDRALTKLDTSGTVLWEYEYGELNEFEFEGLTESIDEGLVLAGWGNYSLYGDACIEKLNKNGLGCISYVPISDSTVDINLAIDSFYTLESDTFYEETSILTQGSGGSFDNHCFHQCSATFTLIADSTVLHHYWLIADVAGIPPINYIWSWGDGTTDTSTYPSHTYDTAGFYNICLITVDSVGCTDSTCVGYDLQKSEEMLTIITVNVVDSVPDIATGIANENILQSLSVYPNPVSTAVFVNYSLSFTATVKMELFDVLGNKLEEMSNELDAGEHRIEITTREFSNGVYYLKIQAGEQIVSQKIVVVN